MEEIVQKLIDETEVFVRKTFKRYEVTNLTQEEIGLIKTELLLAFGRQSAFFEIMKILRGGKVG